MTQKICIYGLGDYGLEIYFRLKVNSVQIDLFADRDKRKHGYVLEGKYCISYEELIHEDKNCLIIVAMKNPENMISKFKQEGFRLVYDKEKAFEILTEKSEKNYASENKPLQDIIMIEKVKENIQGAVYRGRWDSCYDLQDVLSDFVRRHAGEDLCDKTVVYK